MKTLGYSTNLVGFIISQTMQRVVLLADAEVAIDGERLRLLFCFWFLLDLGLELDIGLGLDFG